MKFDRDKFIADALSLVGRDVPWEHQGRDPETGLDCIGLPRWAVNQQMPLPPELEAEFAAYHHKPDGWRMLAIMRRWFLEIDTHDQQRLNLIAGHEPGDLVVMYFKRNPCHMGVLVSETEVVEAFKQGNFASVRKGEPRLPVAAVFRIPEFVDG